MGKVVTVEFRQDTLFAVERDDGVYVALKPICDRLGVEWRKQRERIQRDPILAEGSTMVVLPSPGGPQETLCIKLELVNGWLFGIDENRVKPEARDLVLAYKRECYAVLHRHFYGRGVADRHEPLDASTGEDARRESVRVRRQLVSEARQSFGAHAARQLWMFLNLPVTEAMRNPVAPEFPFTYTAIRQDPPKDEAA